MTTNKYFNYYGNANNSNERDLISGFVAESIQMFGIDVYYIPKQIQKEDTVFQEDSNPKYETKYLIEVYIENPQGWQGQSDTIGLFGYAQSNQTIFHINSKRFLEVTGKVRPYEGDIFYIALADKYKGMFEINFVEHESQFYPLGEMPSLKIHAEQKSYSGETLNTGIVELDAVEHNSFSTDTSPFIDPFSKNKQMQDLSDMILNLTEKNPFGNP